MSEVFEPTGPTFFGTSGREYKVVRVGPWKGWLAYRHPDGQWVSLRKLTLEELEEYQIEVDTEPLPERPSDD